MNVTDIRIRRTYEEGKLKALVSVTIDQDLAVHDIKVIEGSERLFVAMPAEKMITAYSGILSIPLQWKDAEPWKGSF